MFASLLLNWRLYAAGALALGLTFGAGFVFGGHKAELAAVEKAADLETKRVEEVGRLNDKLTEKERQHVAEITDLRREFAEKNTVEREADARRIADLSAGNERLRLRFVTPRCATPSAGAASAPGGVDGTTSAELAPEVGAALFGIASDGDSAIRQLTGLQAYTLNLYKTCQGKP